MAISSDDFRTALSRFSSGITVVTTKDGNGRMHGITVSAFCSVSLDPPLVLICVEKSTGSYHALGESGLFVVNVLSSEHVGHSEHFASQIADKFVGVEFSLNIDGVPVISGCIATLECRVRQTCDGGDHGIFIGEVERSAVYEGDPLIYFRSDYRSIAD